MPLLAENVSDKLDRSDRQVIFLSRNLVSENRINANDIMPKPIIYDSSQDMVIQLQIATPSLIELQCDKRRNSNAFECRIIKIRKTWTHGNGAMIVAKPANSAVAPTVPRR